MYLGDAYPGSLSERVETKLVGDFGSVHGVLRKLVWVVLQTVYHILEDPACWQRPRGEHHGVRPRSACAATLL